MDGVRVRVPASSANLGPGFDSFAVALALHLEVEVRPADSFELQTELDVPRDRSNVLVQAFERLHPADGLSFHVRSSIPLSGGLGSSAAARVAGLLAADAIRGGESDILALAGELEGHPDNAAAALHGGFVVCDPEPPRSVARIAPPADLAAIVVVPQEAVETTAARAALPAQVPLGDAAFNVARAALLALGLERGDLELVARGLDDRLHQPHRAPLYPRSSALVGAAHELGALGATISGAGPTVLVWCRAQQLPVVEQALRSRAGGWASVLVVGFEAAGASVTAL